MIDTELKFGEVHNLTAQIESGSDRVHFKSIFNTENGGVALVAFKEGQKLDEHVAPAELMVNVLEGEIEFNIHGKPHIIKTGEFILLGTGVPHSVSAKSDTKMMLVKVRG